MSSAIEAFAPGRVNLIGDHTDYTGGFVLPVAIDLGTTVHLTVGGRTVDLTSRNESGRALVSIDDAGRPLPDGAPPWARYVQGTVRAVHPEAGGRGWVASTVPLRSGLSSSAASEVALALALGFTGTPLELARVCQRAEHLAVGVPCGIMDQLTSAAGVAGHALLIDCTTETTTPIPLPEDADIWVVPSGEERALADSAYAERRAQCEQAATIVGPLRDASPDAVDRIADPLIRARARHVVNENARVRACADALAAHDLVTAGALMFESHISLRDDFEVSTAALDDLVDSLSVQPGVYGARLTGAGFGGSVIALAARGTRVQGGRRVRAGDGAHLVR
jgi:galactokinase